MNKKLIALAVAAAFAAPAAMAEVTVYGKVHMDVVSTDSSTTDNIEVTSNNSRLGFKGTEDLSNGLKAIFRYEMTYSGVDSAEAIGAARNSYIGLTGDFGTLLVGRRDTPAKSAFYAAGNDHLGDSIIDLNRMGFSERRVNNNIAYFLPNMSGFKAGVSIMPGEQSGENDSNDENGLVDSYSLGVMYKGQGLKAGLGYEKIADARTTTADNYDETTLNIGASYTMSDFTFGAQYAKHDNVEHADGAETDVWAIVGKYALDGNNVIIANYGNSEAEAADNTTAETDYIGLAFQHKMSKRTSAYIAYNQQDPDGGESTDQIAVGLIHNF